MIDRAYRIAMVAPCPFPSLRGSQVLMRELAEQLANAGHRVHVVTYPTAQHIVPLERISIHRVPKLPALWTARPFGWQKVVLDLLLFCVLLRVVRRECIDVVHAHNLEGPLIGYLVRFFTGVPVVYHAHNALTDELPCYFRSPTRRRWAKRAGAFLDRRVALKADFSIALSDRLGAFLAVRGAAGRVAIVPPAVGRVSKRDRIRCTANNRLLVMYAGNLDPYQNLECLLEGFEQVRAVEPGAELVVVTHRGAHRETERRGVALERQPGVSVRVVGTFAAADRELRRADVLVCPRGSWSGFPIKVLNYMALGRPIVSACGSAHAIEDGVSGLLFNDGDAASLAKAILRLARDRLLAERLGRQARDAARQGYSWSRLLPRILDVYERVVKSGDAAGDRRPEERRPRQEETMKPRTASIESDGSSRKVGGGRRHLEVFGLVVLLAGIIGCTRAHREVVAPLPPLSAPLAPGVPGLSGHYLIEPGDKLRVKFLYHPELDVKVPVGPDGSISIQGVGDVAAEGKTADQLAANIEERSSDRLRDPEVTVIVAELGRRQVYVGGEVRLPGPVTYREGLTPLQAILDRGGFTEVARLDSVLHLSPDGNTYKAARLDFTTEVSEGDPEINTLGVYDVIYVPRTFIGDANAFVRLYIRGLMPTMPRLGIGFSP